MLYNPIGYIIRTIIRRIIYLLINKKTLKILIISALIIGWLFISTKLGSFAYAYDYTYSDPNTSIVDKYEGIVNKGILLIENSTASNKQELIDLLKNSQYVHYFYFGSSISGVGNTDDFNQLNIGFVPSNDLDFTLSNQYTTYMGVPCNIGSANNPYRIYSISNSSCWYATGYNFYVPEPLVYYTSNTLVNWLTDYSSSQNNQIANVIQSQTDSINAQTNTIQQTQDFLEDDTISNSEMSVNTNYSFAQQSDENNFFQTFFQNIYDKYNLSTSPYSITINIPIPFTESTLNLNSNLIASPLSRYGSAFYNLIGAFWWFIFARYFINFARWLIAYITSGKIFGEGGVSQFVNELQNNDVVIKSNMV